MLEVAMLALHTTSLAKNLGSQLGLYTMAKRATLREAC